MWRWKNTRTQWKLRSLGKHRTGELSSHVWWHRRLLIYHTWVKNWQIYAKARAMKWGLLVDYHRFTLPMSFQWRRPSHHTRQRHEVTGAENGHAPAGEAWSWSTRSSQEVPRALGLALHITAYLHIPTYTFKYRCVCVCIYIESTCTHIDRHIYIYIPYHTIKLH